ncbi:hypothetical protein [Dentiradicibacter hellwigii]|uniref:Uncharacterized protein n=1 Tax=Dentiradicibacter hellwigii TaxID=3149053 RepID=A0ABV4UF54_9RHOO
MATTIISSISVKPADERREFNMDSKLHERKEIQMKKPATAGFLLSERNQAHSGNR